MRAEPPLLDPGPNAPQGAYVGVLPVGPAGADRALPRYQHEAAIVPAEAKRV